MPDEVTENMWCDSFLCLVPRDKCAALNVYMINARDITGKGQERVNLSMIPQINRRKQVGEH
jgi:hypothetical protein